MSESFLEREMTVKKVERMETFYNYVILIGFIGILVAGGLAVHEFLGAKRFCNSVDGDYSVKFLPLPPTHFCNGEEIGQYCDGWDFKSYRELNYSITLP